jgi:hypothetical protein
MTRFAPRSLFSRMVLVLLGGLLAAQLLSFGIHMHERGEALSQASGMQAAQRIADIVKLLETLGPADRRRIVRVFSAPPLAISLDRRPLEARALGAEDSARAALFGAMLGRFLGDGRPAAVAVAEDAAVQPAARMKPGFMGPAAHAPWMAPGAALHFGMQPGFSFVAQVHLSDGSLVTFDSRQPAQTAGWPYRLLASIAVLLAAVIAVSLIAVRWRSSASGLAVRQEMKPIPGWSDSVSLRVAAA